MIHAITANANDAKSTFNTTPWPMISACRAFQTEIYFRIPSSNCRNAATGGIPSWIVLPRALCDDERTGTTVVGCVD